MNTREYRAVASMPDASRTPVSVAVYHDRVRRAWGAYVILEGVDAATGRGRTGPVAWGVTGDAATRRAVADYYMASIQVTLPWGGAE